MRTPETETATEIREPVAQDADRPGVGDAARQVSQHASALIRLELELAALELKKKVAALAVGIAFGLAAVVVLLYALGFGLATIATGLDSFMPRWLALLVVTLVLVIIAGLLGMLALRAVKRGSPPVPRQAIREAKLTTEALKRDGATA